MTDLSDDDRLLRINAAWIVDQLARAGEPLIGALDSDLDPHEIDDGRLHSLVRLLDDRVVMRIALDAEGFAVATAATNMVELDQGGWRHYLVRVENQPRVAHPVHRMHDLGLSNMTGLDSLAIQPQLFDRIDKSGEIADTWMVTELPGDQTITGASIQYLLLAIFARDAGEHTEYLAVGGAEPFGGIHVGWQGALVQFAVRPAYPVRLDIVDHDGRSCMFSIRISDSFGRVYPPRKMRIAPDMFFHDHIYRATGETVQLPAGNYDCVVRRGPEYAELTVHITVRPETSAVVTGRLSRWSDATRFGYFPGDAHIHAAGCSHYAVPTQGVAPETMIRHVRGEALSVGGVLNWGPSYHHQRQFFSGSSVSPSASLEHPELQLANNVTWVPQPTETDVESVLRYDMEISGFPSSHSGHLVLLGLAEPDFPNTSEPGEWPSWNLPILRWARAQGALAGYAHGHLGMNVDSEELPNYQIPAFNSVGMDEVFVDAVTGDVDFIGGAQDYPVYELNGWYHLLNAGYRILMLGETDYPCIFDERPGVGRTYAPLRLDGDLPLSAEAWIAGVQSLSSYFGDGRSHLQDLRVRTESERSGRVTVSAIAQAWLDPDPESDVARIRRRPPYADPPWHIERARHRSSRSVAVELIVNGVAVDSVRVEADGARHLVEFVLELEASSWLALRIFASSHTQANWVEIAGRDFVPLPASARWCADAVERLWATKSRFIRPEERTEAQAAYLRAIDEYRRRADVSTSGGTDE